MRFRRLHRWHANPGQRCNRRHTQLPGRRTSIPGLLSLLLLFVLGTPAAIAQVDVTREAECCDMTSVSQQVVYVGSDSKMTFEELASYCGPILWFSPDEPLLRHVRKDPLDINLPMAFPFEAQADGPVVYYRVRKIVSNNVDEARGSIVPRQADSSIDLEQTTAIELDYFFYYPSEEGFGGHRHDVESVEMSVVVLRQPNCTECRYALWIHKITAKAHGVLWYDNTLTADGDTEFPLTILVEEGKHASCTDKNGDGYFTPGYDVSERVNDAWGVRDVMRTGALFTGGYQAWLSKVRNPQDRVFPPLPPDSPLLDEYLIDGEYMPTHNKYEVRPFPTVEEALASGDESLRRFVDKGDENWPAMVEDTGIEHIADFIEGREFIKSVSIAARFDNEVGISFVFPLFIVKHMNDPVSGGWIVNRIYLKDKKLRDFSWQLMYTPSASRWIDQYLSAGVEIDKDGSDSKTWFASEAGLKFRFNIAHTPISFMSKLTDFWGLRAGIRYRAYKSFTDIGYVIEIGAGTF
jgi:hypothetical protein